MMWKHSYACTPVVIDSELAAFHFENFGCRLVG